jgi:hypothetical protein
MLVYVSASLEGLLSLFSCCFTQPTFRTFRALVVGQVSQTGRRTVTGMLVGARQSGVSITLALTVSLPVRAGQPIGSG